MTPHPAIRPIRLLLVDDHAMVRNGMRTLLGIGSEFEVVGEASDGLAAVGEYYACKPDVTLMDLRMPAMGGIEALSAIRITNPEAKILVLTSYDAPSDIRQAMEQGAMGFLLKASSGHEIMDAIRRVHAGERVFDGGLVQQLNSPSTSSWLK